MADYQYDALNRLELLEHFIDEDGDRAFDAGDEELRARFDYELNLDGSRKKVTETDDQGRQTVITWTYDNLNRLVREDLDHYDNSVDYTTDYVLDLTGNRLSKVTDKGRDSDTDEVITYVYDSNDYDSNDRLLTEKLDSDGDTDTDQTTVYAYGASGGGTEQTKKTSYEGTDTSGSGVKVSETEFAYNLQGRLSGATIRTYTGGSLTATSTTSYLYNDSGIRVSQTVDGVTTEYVIDANNHTGYAQVLEEWVGGVLSKTYTLGHDVIAQQSPTQASGDTLTFLYDGHGSTRALLDALGAATERYAYDAYGNLLAGVGLTSANTLTSLLYSGEQFDAKLRMQYLRARYYDPSTGRFNRVDPFAGSVSDPQGLHKYLYGHATPTLTTDPTGLAVEFDSAKGLLVHAFFYVQVWAQGGNFDLPIGQLTNSFLTQAIYFLLRPDAVFLSGALKGFYELKPISHRDSKLSYATNIQMSIYDVALAPLGIGRGDNLRLIGAPAAMSPVLGGVIWDFKNFYEVTYYAEDELTPRNYNGRGLIYYSLKKIDLPPPRAKRVPRQVPISDNARENIWIYPSLQTVALAGVGAAAIVGSAYILSVGVHLLTRMALTLAFRFTA